MPNSDDPFAAAGRDEAAAAARSRQADVRRCRPAASRRRRRSAMPSRFPASARALLGIGLNPLVRAASPLLLLTAQMREALSSDGRRRAPASCARGDSPIRGAGARVRRVERGRPGRAVCAVRRPRRGGPVDALGQSERMGPAPAAGGVASRGVGRREVLRDAGPDLAGSDPPHRPDGAAVSRVWPSASPASTRCRSAGTSTSCEVQQDLYRKIRNHRGPASRSCRCAGADSRTGAIRSFGMCPGGSSARRRCRSSRSRSRCTTPASPASPSRCTRSSRRWASRTFRRHATPFAVEGPTLKQLLAPEEKAGALSVEEQGSRTTVTLLAPDLFASGSATVNPAYHETLQRLTAALNKVPGRVLVVGHTDDQPIKSLRYQDNFELSRERAVSVVNLLQQAHRQPRQTELDRRRLVGAALPPRVGSGEPRAQPARGNRPRARNLRSRRSVVTAGVSIHWWYHHVSFLNAARSSS